MLQFAHKNYTLPFSPPLSASEALNIQSLLKTNLKDLEEK